MISPLVFRRSASSVTNAPLREAAAQLLPPIPLYRRILRVHRALPSEMRIIGDGYVKVCCVKKERKKKWTSNIDAFFCVL
jgi:hypothetical protein